MTLMRERICLAAAACCLAVVPLHSAEESPDYIPMSSATVQIMNKQAGKTQTVVASIDKPIKFDKMEIRVRKCLATNEFLPEDFFMFAEISKSGKRIFSGWMTKSEPGQNPLQDADNDLWLVKCE